MTLSGTLRAGGICLKGHICATCETVRQGCQTNGECRSRMMFRSSYIIDVPRKQVNGRPLYENMLQGDTAAIPLSEGGAVLSASYSLLAC